MLISWLIFLGAALLEVGGDASIWKGLRFARPILIIIGFFMLGFYGLLVNSVRWNFSKMLGVYVAVFALVSVLWGQFALSEKIPAATWVGLVLIMIGGLTIQLGSPQ